MRSSWAALVLAVVLVGCSDQTSGQDKGFRDKNTTDGAVCRRPPTIDKAYCDAPPNGFSPTKYYCWGCTCAGGTSVAACNGQTGDCRYFADGCYPMTYTLCDKYASQFILGLCNDCFFHEAGVVHCNHLPDAGGVLKELGGSDKSFAKDLGAAKH
jgi:hypothetical protein